ncbi:MAG: hypothetical protein CGW95_03620 [Phenylobacterium zucineum]|nr:MAG: hypothetical protein CGW95_03620 [Phenylobacterium zucineum]
MEGGNVRTGVTVILPRPPAAGPEPTRASFHSFNGNGEMTGALWIREAGYFSGPVCLTNTNAIGAVQSSLELASTKPPTKPSTLMEASRRRPILCPLCVQWGGET